MKIAFYSCHSFEEPFIKQANSENHELVLVEKSLNSESIKKAKGCKAVALFSTDDATESILKKLKEMGVENIVTRSSGVDHIDLEAAEALGMKVANVPRYSPHAIAEFCVALTLSLFRKLKPTYQRIGNYNFSLDGQVGMEINSKTVGIVGTGDIGVALAKIFNGFGARVLLFDAKKNPKIKGKKWAQYVDKNKLLENSDIISLNLPLNDDTKYFIAKNELKKMKKSAVLVNTGRGELVNTKDVYTALKNNNLAGFAMDVYENEKGIFYNNKSDSKEKDELLVKLIEMGNVSVTAHQAFLTHEALQNMMRTTFKNVENLVNDEHSKNVVTKT